MVTQSPTENSCLVRTIAILLFIGLMIGSVAAVFLFNANLILLRRETYKSALVSEDVYPHVPALAAEQLTWGSGDSCEENICRQDVAIGMAGFLGIPADYLFGLNRGRWEAVFGVLMPVEWLRPQTEIAIDQIFDGLESGAQPITALISVDSMRSRLTDQDYQAITQTILDSAQICTPDQLLTMAAILIGVSEAPVPFCLPTEEYRPLMESQIDSTLRNMMQRLPPVAALDMSRLVSTNRMPAELDGEQPDGPNAVNRFERMRVFFMLSPLVPLALLLLLGLAAVRSWHDAGHWLGIPLLAAGLLVMALTAALLLASPWLVSNLILPSINAPLSTSVEQALQNIIRAVELRYIFWSAISAGVLFLAGAGLLASSSILKPR